MKRVIVLGAGHIGTAVTQMLSGYDYFVFLADQEFSPKAKDLLNRTLVQGKEVDSLDCTDVLKDLFSQVKNPQAVISCLPYSCNTAVAETAYKMGMHYFDLTEDVETAEYIKAISEDVGNHKAQTAFVPQCGLAPGFVSIVANSLMTEFDDVHTVKMRVGSLPAHPNNKLKYNLMWSTNGLINEYGNLCQGIKDSVVVDLEPLVGLETIIINGVKYEAFNTSGGIGTLVETCTNKVQYLTYKTLRYPGHCELIRFLMDDLSLNKDRKSLERIFENAIPTTRDDLVVIYVSVTGWINNQFVESNYVNKIYPSGGYPNTGLTAIELTTAAGVCGIVDLVLQNPDKHKGFVKNEDFNLTDFLNNRFGNVYANKKKNDR